MSENEKQILEALRDLRPYETITIQKDAQGRPDYFIIKREQKIFFTDICIDKRKGV